VHALRNIHASLAPDGLLVDTQPISPHPRVTINDTELGTLDMREWVETIQAVEERVNETMAAGLYELTDERDLSSRVPSTTGPTASRSPAPGKAHTFPRCSRIDSPTCAIR
jgi:hypothetical protein